MSKLSRRSVLRGSLGLAGGTLARPYIANAAAKTASIWWAQGFIAEEDASFRNTIAAYEKASGNTIEYSIVPFAPLNQKVISALTSGDVPDLISVDGSDRRIVPQNAWLDKLVDMTDVVETQKSQYHPTAILASQYYNNVTKTRSYYYVPYKTAVLPAKLPRIAVEMGVTQGWWKYGCAAVVGIDTYGESAPAPVLFKHFGFTPENVAKTVRVVLAKK